MIGTIEEEFNIELVVNGAAEDERQVVAVLGALVPDALVDNKVEDVKELDLFEGKVEELPVDV